MNILPLSCLLAVAWALPNPVNGGSGQIDENNPSTGNPKIPPTSISFPAVAEDPFPSGIPNMPDGCDGQNPSDDCFSAMKKSKNYIWFDKNSGCSQEQKDQIKTAVWDATTLATYASAFPQTSETRGQFSGAFWMGPDWPAYQSRISGNFGRIGKWKTSEQSEYITVSCTDTKKQCGRRVGDNKSVGGYAWTYSGWRAYYYYITLCPPFFTIDSLNHKMDDVRDALQRGDTRYATDMNWLRTTAQYFLHEMMHLRIANGKSEPHIGDQFIDAVAVYGAPLVHKLAQRKPRDDGGANMASINADSYAILANSLWWWDTTGYFPDIPAKTTDESRHNGSDAIVQLFVDLYKGVDPSTLPIATWDEIYAPQIQLYAGEEGDSNSVPTTTVYVTPVPAGPTQAV